MVDDGSILFTARSERSQEQNRRAAAERLAALIRTALIEPKIRKKTRPDQGVAGTAHRIEKAARRDQIAARPAGMGLASLLGLLPQRHLQNAVPDLLRQHQLRVGRNPEQRLAEHQFLVVGQLNDIALAQ